MWVLVIIIAVVVLVVPANKLIERYNRRVNVEISHLDKLVGFMWDIEECAFEARYGKMSSTWTIEDRIRWCQTMNLTHHLYYSLLVLRKSIEEKK